MGLPLKSSGIYLLIKTSALRYLEDFADGNLHCNHPEFFRRLEHRGKPFYDQDEGISAIFQPDQVSVEFRPHGREPLKIQPGAMAGPLKLWMEQDYRVFCMYALHPGDWNKEFGVENLSEFISYMSIKPNMSGYGSHVAVVTNAKEFVRRVQEACKTLRVSNSGDLVTYLDLVNANCRFPEDRHGRIKNVKFKDEREFRFIFYRNHEPIDAPFRLYVGSLRDIVIIKPWEAFRRRLILQFPGDPQQHYVVKPKRLPRKLKKLRRRLGWLT